jgi:hypothetical protein
MNEGIIKNKEEETNNRREKRTKNEQRARIN